GPALRNVHLGREGVRRVEDARRVAVRCPGNLAGPGKLGAPCRKVGTWGDEPGGHRRVEGQDLRSVRSSQNRLAISLTFSGYFSATLSNCVQSSVTSYSSYGKPAGSWLTAEARTHGGRMTLVLAIQPSW